MSASADVRAILETIPGWSDAAAKVAAVEGGLTNRAYRVYRANEQYLLRLEDGHTGAYGIDRDREFAIQSAAARRGLAPAVVYADPERGVLLCRYVAGRTWSREDLGDPQRLDAVAALLRSVHALPLAGHVLEPAEVGRRYLQGLAGDDALYGRGAALVAWLTDIGPADNVRCCHNDVVAGNLIEATGLMLLDWEYAADNDPLFDLASLVAFHELDDAAARVLLAAYQDGPGTDALDRFQHQLAVYRALAWLWFAVRERARPDAEQRRRMERMFDALRPVLRR